MRYVPIIGPIIKAIEAWLGTLGDGIVTGALFMVAGLLLLAAIKLPSPAKLGILGWVVLP